jgi:dTDP-L-rhamnose 4-epimerase
VFEDGRQMRDFVHVDDVARANRVAVEAVAGDASVGDTTVGHAAYNVASGHPVCILDVARAVARGHGAGLEPVVTGEYRAGDVRHVVASPALASAELGFRARVAPHEGLARLATDPLRQ